MFSRRFVTQDHSRTTSASQPGLAALQHQTHPARLIESVTFCE